MTRLLFTLALVVALVALPVAQVMAPNQSITVVDSGTACVTAPTACATYALDSNSPSVTLNVAGTWTGTLTFEGTNNDADWTTLLVVNLASAARVSTTTTSGLFGVHNPGLIKVRLRATAAVTGTARITAARGSGLSPNAT